MRKLSIAVAAGALVAGSAWANHHEEGEKDKGHEAPELVGAYGGEGFVVTFMPEGLFAVASTESGATGVIGKFGAKDGMMWVKDLAGGPPEADAAEKICVKENKGKYSYTVDGDNISWTMVEDPCAGRVEAINGTTLTKLTMGDADE